MLQFALLCYSIEVDDRKLDTNEIRGNFTTQRQNVAKAILDKQMFLSYFNTHSRTIQFCRIS